MKRVPVFFVMCLLAQSAWAGCTADVENEGAKLSGHTFYTTWRVRHNAGNNRQATVYFDYKIRYRNKRGTQLADSHVFMERINGQGKQLTKENYSSGDPVEILSVDFDHIDCRD